MPDLERLTDKLNRGYGYLDGYAEGKDRARYEVVVIAVIVAVIYVSVGVWG